MVLIDAWAISQAGHTCLLFAAATDVTFIGSPTNGANGDMTNMVLPGNLVVSFTGQEVRFAGGHQLQRVGVQPHPPIIRWGTARSAMVPRLSPAKSVSCTTRAGFIKTARMVRSSTARSKGANHLSL